MSIQVTNIIPQSMSGETERDSEPSITINPINPLQIALSAFGPFTGLTPGPLFISVDGGNTWAQNFILPGGSKTNDTSIRFGGTSGKLYMGILRIDNGNLNILRSDDFTMPAVTTLLDRGSDDQPWIEAATVMGGSGVNSDRIYVGNNNFLQSGGKTASVDFSLNAATAAPPAGFIASTPIEVRANAGQDGPSVRCAIHQDGTVYAAYFGWRTQGASTISDVVLVRDDNWASGTHPFTNLLGADGFAGMQIVAGVQIVSLNSASLGTERIGSHLRIAVDPRNSSTVYVAWCDGTSASAYTLHVRCSTNRGQTWSADLRTIVSAANPGLAINSHGKIALLYQQLNNPGSGNRWRTHLEMSDDGFATPPTDLILADVPDENGTYTGNNPIGDYANVIAFGKDFYGTFCANNSPIMANFPNGVTYLRNANFTTHQLLDTDGVTPVTESVDPFFFRWTELSADQDFYVRDWTVDAANRDIGQEPSTNPWFFESSDIWNSNNNNPGTIANDWYQGQDPTASAGTAGDNYAFARISRNGSGSDNTVNAEFFFADYGLGVPYASVGSQTISFGASDVSKLTSGQSWHLDASASTHVCLAVQINTTEDPYLLPSLAGMVPGWPYPDLLVINDNNKAQRNLTTVYVSSDVNGSMIMRIRNAAMFGRDMNIKYDVPAIYKRIPKSKVGLMGGESKPFRSGDSIILKNMKPGESRWLTFECEAPQAKKFELPVRFYEMNGNQAVNGCTALVTFTPLENVIKSALQFQLSMFNRLAAIGVAVNDEAVEITKSILRTRKLKEGYLKNSSTFHSTLATLIKTLDSESLHSLGFEKELKIVSAQASVSRLPKALSAHMTLLKKIDCAITINQLVEGDPASVLFNVHFQLFLFKSNAKLNQLSKSAEMAKFAGKFAKEYSLGKITNGAYVHFIKKSLPCLKETAESLSGISKDLYAILGNLERSSGSIRALQKFHYTFLIRIFEYL